MIFVYVIEVRKRINLTPGLSIEPGALDKKQNVTCHTVLKGSCLMACYVSVLALLGMRYHEHVQDSEAARGTKKFTQRFALYVFSFEISNTWNQYNDVPISFREICM